MAYTGRFFDIPGLLAGADLSAKQYYAVRLASTAGEVVVATTSKTSIMAGILQNDPTDGQAAIVACAGVAKGSAEGAISAGDFLTCNSTGQLQATTTANDRVIGIALEAATTVNDLIPVLLAFSKY